jgi:hypothetical protein
VKFFTLDWWHGVQEFESRDVFDEYQIHFDRISDRLPHSLVQLHQEVSLHDANVTSMTTAVDAGVLQIQLLGYTREGGVRRIQLGYSGVKTIQVLTGSPLGGPTGFGDLGYCEVHVADAELLEHDLLFSSGIELQIMFSDLDLTWTDE